MRTIPWLFVLPFQGEIFRVAFLLFLGRCPQAMLFQSFGLERPQPCETGGAVPTGHVISVLRTEKHNHARQIGRCPRLCCFSPSDWKGQPHSTDRALPQAMLFQSFGLEKPTMRDRLGGAHRLCCFSPSDWKGPNHARQVGRCPQAMLFQYFGLERPQPCATDRALPTGYVVSVLRTEKHSHKRQPLMCP